MAYSQENRLISLTTPLGEDKLLLMGFSGYEAMSRLFNFQLDLVSDQGAVDFSQIINQNVTISLTQSDDSQRYFNGHVSRFAQTGGDNLTISYHMEVVPSAWTLTRYANCKIFHEKTVGDIIKQIFDDRSITNYKFSLTASYTPLEYCVQYRETDFNFISRLMEQYGIFYFFQHEDGKHTMVIADSPSVNEACPGQETASYNQATGGLDDGDNVNSWTLELDLKSGKYTIADYNFTTPSANLQASEPTTDAMNFGNSQYEIYDFPGDFTTRAEGTTMVKLRMQEEEADHMVARGSSVCRAFATGYKFTLEDNPQASMNGEYLLTEVQHIASVASTYGGKGGASSDSYSNTFTCIPTSIPFRPIRLTPKPFVQGPQTAVVVGKNAGDEIYVDKYGRVVVLFPWDRANACSCWVRVSQEWAGLGYGTMYIPRVGQEVIVSFLEGDPDRPIVTGRVYNANQTVPWTLPDNQTQSGVKTHSSKGGTDQNYNMIRFEDKKGSEDLLIHAEKTMHNSVETTQTITTGVDRDITVGGMDEYGNKIGTVHEKIFLDSNLHVLNEQRIKIEKGRSLHVMGVHNQLFDDDNSVHMMKQQVTKIEDDETHHVVGNRMIQVDNNMSTWVQDQAIYEFGNKVSLTATNSCLITAHHLILQGLTDIVLVAGSSSITINSSGIAIVGSPLLNLNSPGASPSIVQPPDVHRGPDPADPVDPVDPP